MKDTLLESDARRPARAAHWRGNLEPILIRLSPEYADAVRALSRQMRIPIAVFYREAVEDLLRKYGALPAPGPGGGTTGGA